MSFPKTSLVPHSCLSPLLRFPGHKITMKLPRVLAWVANVSVRFRSKERGTRVKDGAKNGSCFISREDKSENLVPRSVIAPKLNGNAFYAGYACSYEQFKFAPNVAPKITPVIGPLDCKPKLGNRVQLYVSITKTMHRLQMAQTRSSRRICNAH